MDQKAAARLTRKQKRVMQQGNFKEPSFKLTFRLKDVQPLTDNQRLTFDYYDTGKNLLLHGIAGTGKSFLSIYLSLRSILSDQCRYKKLVIVRSVVPTRDMGFLPGNNKEKAKVYEAPYQAIFNELFDRGDAYEFLKNKNLVDFISTSFIRGITLNDCIIVVDEIANMTLHELDSVITRVGKNCKIIFCGDFRQSDFTKENERNGLKDFMRIINKMDSFEFVDFDENDIVRSRMVKEYIIAKDRLKIVA
ncbi:PhoH Phosphate starvation-inducible protein PhoH, predicted ATPase [uncultured Caudovirales phage]|uniref:PhoH Phosphate starvation-inducible protein PhoH, predicted ATPase n=1 Tax=uncultured Caudovirales phage TaxID=2100421 RepID=A0A6J5LAK0_9CAUD|nr:PhoH Phosphate starvation-inducible protein PhoH, predicted ATPase [uncultured Caudovirales phage]